MSWMSCRRLQKCSDNQQSSNSKEQANLDVTTIQFSDATEDLPNILYS